MDALQLLEQRISYLVGAIKELKTKNDLYSTDMEKVSKEYEELKMHNAKLIEENSQLLVRIDALEKESMQGHDKVDELNQEKMLTKLAVDDLLERLKLIDSIVQEYQQ